MMQSENEEDIQLLDDVRSLAITKADPNELYARLRIQLFEMKRASSAAQKTAAAQTRAEIHEKMDVLETHVQYDKEHAASIYKDFLQESVAATKERVRQARLTASAAKEANTTTEDPELPFDVFADLPADTSSAAPKKAPSKAPQVTIRSLSVSGWTGKVPRQLLQDTLRREDHYVKISYAEIRSPRGIRAKCTVKPGQGEPMVFKMREEACETKLEAEHYAAVCFPLVTASTPLTFAS